MKLTAWLLRQSLSNRFALIAVLFILLIIGLAACNPFAPGPAVFPADQLPDAYSLYVEGPKRPERWWETFEREELNTLIEKALAGNFSLRESWARLHQAEAVALRTGAPLFPDLDLETGASRVQKRIDTGTTASTQTVDEIFLGLASSYELDLWGRLRSELQAAEFETSASRQAVYTAAMTLAAEVAVRWVNILSQRKQKELLNEQLKLNRTYLELVELRFDNAMVSSLDVYQQKQAVERVQAQIPLVESRETILRHELALLIGQPPKTQFQITSTTFPEIRALPSTGLPVDLLEARPDVRAAGMKLRAAEMKVAAARANRLPALKLTAQAHYEAENLDLLFDNWILNLAANLTAPLFDGRQRAAEVDRTRAVVDENLAAYRLAVLTAVKEVEDALIQEEKQKEHIKALTAQIDTARKAFEQAGQRYLNGLSDYLPVLTQLVSLQNLEIDLIQKQAELVVTRINLFRALGGGRIVGDDQKVNPSEDQEPVRSTRSSLFEYLPGIVSFSNVSEWKCYNRSILPAGGLADLARGVS